MNKDLLEEISNLNSKVNALLDLDLSNVIYMFFNYLVKLH